MSTVGINRHPEQQHSVSAVPLNLYELTQMVGSTAALMDFLTCNKYAKVEAEVIEPLSTDMPLGFHKSLEV